MATTKSKSSPKLLGAGKWPISWTRLFIAASLVLNIGFVVVWVSLAGTNTLDGVFMANGLERYCSAGNDDKFKDSTSQVKGLRSYVCDTPDAHQYFQDGLTKYFDAKGIPHGTKE